MMNQRMAQPISAGLFGYDESENGTAYFGAQYL